MRDGRSYPTEELIGQFALEPVPVLVKVSVFIVKRDLCLEGPWAMSAVSLPRDARPMEQLDDGLIGVEELVVYIEGRERSVSGFCLRHLRPEPDVNGWRSSDLRVVL